MQRNVRAILSKLPQTLDETYERLLRDIHDDNKEHARRLLHCLAVSVRPLRVEELAEILTFDFDAAEGGIPEYHADWRWKDQGEAVLSTCSSLITITESHSNDDDDDNGYYSEMRVVQFSHFSVKEFLMSNRLATPTRDISRYHILPRTAHTILIRACLGFLLHLDGHIDTECVKDFPLAKYAAEHWVVHAQFQDVASLVMSGMMDLFNPDKPYFASWVGIHNIDSFLSSEFSSALDMPTRPTSLYYSALLGFQDLTKHLAIKNPQHVNAIGGLCDSPLLAALSQSHVSVAKILLEYGGNVNIHGTRGRTPLHMVLLADYEDKDNRIVWFLLECSTDVNARDEDNQTPLHTLLDSRDFHHSYHPRDHVLIAQLLLERGADVNAQNKGFETPLHLAMRPDYEPDVSWLLLQYGANPNLKNEEGRPPLHVLLTLDWVPGPPGTDYVLVVAQLLLEHGADVNARDKDHETALFLAMRLRMSNIAQVLLDWGADPNLKNKDGKTPLHIILGPQDFRSSSSYHSADYIFDVLQLLVERGVDVNARDNDHETPLFLALRRSVSKTAPFLLDHGTGPNAENREGETSPQTRLLERDNDNDDSVLILQLLLIYGADVGARDKNHLTPLDLAPYCEKSLIARLLLDHAVRIDWSQRQKLGTHLELEGEYYIPTRSPQRYPRVNRPRCRCCE